MYGSFPLQVLVLTIHDGCGTELEVLLCYVCLRVKVEHSERLIDVAQWRVHYLAPPYLHFLTTRVEALPKLLVIAHVVELCLVQVPATTS